MSRSRWLRAALFGAVLTALPVLAQAQPEALPSGTVAIAARVLSGTGSTPESAAVILIPPDGPATVTPLPAALFSPDKQVFITAISPDQTRVTLYEFFPAEVTAPQLSVLTLADGSITPLTEPGSGIMSYSDPVFSPDGAQIAAAFIRDPDGTLMNTDGGIVIWNAVDGALAQIVTQTEWQAWDADFFAGASWPLIGPWRADGLRLHPNCFSCEPAFFGQWAIWNPADGTFTTASGEYFNLLGAERLSMTGEVIGRSFDVRFPTGGFGGMLPPANVVQYYPPGAALPSPFGGPEHQGRPVFWDIAQPSLDTPRWVQGGDAIVIAGQLPDSGTVTILRRDGSAQTFPDSIQQAMQRVLVGTADGWVASAQTGGQITFERYTVGADGTFSAEPVSGLTFPSNSDFRVLYAPLVDAQTLPPTAAVQAAVFPEVTPPSPAAVPTLMVEAGRSCAGLLPSRLIAGGMGIVTPGAPNRLRAEPNTNAAILLEMPGDSVFSVIAGPSCDSAGGIAWWQVDYQGTIGWTAELQGQTYFVDPFGI